MSASGTRNVHGDGTSERLLPLPPPPSISPPHTYVPSLPNIPPPPTISLAVAWTIPPSMTDVLQPAPASAVADLATGTEAKPRLSVAEEPGSTSPPLAPAAGKASKGKGLRALRDRIALRRSFSTKHPSVSSPTLLSPTSESRPVAEDAQEATSPVASPKREKRSNPFEHLLIGKRGVKKSGKKSKDEDAAPIPVVLDPAPSTSSASDAPETLSAIPEAEHDVSATGTEDPSAVAPNDSEALPLARKIHSLLTSVPPFLSTVDPPKSDGPSKPPASGAPTIPDSRLFSLLSSPSFMNGSASRGRQSVWSMLDNLRLQALKSSAETDSTTPKPAEGVFEDDDSVMFYVPLVPDNASSVELARSEIVSVDENGSIVDVVVQGASPARLLRSSATDVQAEGWKWHWPWSRTPKPPSQPNTTEKRVWVPSTEKLSVQVMWWGYKLYVDRHLYVVPLGSTHK